MLLKFHGGGEEGENERSASGWGREKGNNIKTVEEHCSRGYSYGHGPNQHYLRNDLRKGKICVSEQPRV